MWIPFRLQTVKILYLCKARNTLLNKRVLGPGIQMIKEIHKIVLNFITNGACST